MKLAPAFLFLVFSPLAFAQEATATPAAAGCGDESAKFDVKNDKHQHPLTQPAEGKALVYFIEDDSQFASIFKPTTRRRTRRRLGRRNSWRFLFLFFRGAWRASPVRQLAGSGKYAAGP